MAVCEGVVNAHVFEIPSNMSIEKPLYSLVVELGVYEDRSNI